MLPFPGPVTPDPVVIALMRQFKADLARAEAAQMAEMAARWLSMENRLSARFDALALELDRLRAAGKPLPISRVIRLDRYKQLIAEIRVELAKYQDYAARLITTKQRDLAALGFSNGTSAIDSAFLSYGRNPLTFRILDVSVIENLIGIAGNGAPLGDLLAASWPDAVLGITNALADAIAMGLNPYETARNLRRGFGIGFNRSINIARTEQLRVYRVANQMQYASSGVVIGYKRLATHDSNVCAGCLMAEGTIYPLDQAFEEHPQGRCTQVPVLRQLPTINWLSGREFFLTQPEAYQRHVLGPGRYEAWQAGKFDLMDVVTRKSDPIWGNSLVPTPLYKLVGK